MRSCISCLAKTISDRLRSESGVRSVRRESETIVSIPNRIRAASIAYAEHYAVHEGTCLGECKKEHTQVRHGWYCHACDRFVQESTVVKPNQAASILAEWAIKRVKAESQ